MATYPTNPALPAGVNATPVNPANWNTVIDNINAIGADLVDARGDGQTFPGTPHTAGQSTDINDMLSSIRNMIMDITGEANWYIAPDNTIAALHANQGGLASTQFLRSDASDSLTAGTLMIDDGAILGIKGTFKIYDTDDSHALSIIWNENDSADRTLNLVVSGGNRTLTFNENFTIGDGYAGGITYQASGKTLYIENNSYLNQDLTTDAAALFSTLGLGGVSSPTSNLEILDAVNPQIRLTADLAVDYADFQVDGDGYLEITTSGGAIVLQASEYLNFGGTAGAAGYGLRDNVGSIEYKDSGGAWTAISAGGGVAASDNIAEDDSDVEVIDNGVAAGEIYFRIDTNEMARITEDGLGILETAPAWPLDVAGAVRIQTSAQPGAPDVGTIYSDGTDIFYYNGVWVDLTASAAGTADIVLSKQSAGTYSVPTAVGKTDDLYLIKKIDASTTAVVLDPNAAETIDGAPKRRLERQYQQLGIVSDGANWWSVSDTGTMLNIKDFGAVGDGSNDDTPAFTAAIAAAKHHDTIYIPRGAYKITSSIKISTPAMITAGTYKLLNFQGEGFYSQIYQASDDHVIEADFSTLSGGCTYISMQDIHLRSTATTSGKSLLYFRRVHDSFFKNITLRGGYYGLYMEGCLRNNIFGMKTDWTSFGFGYGSVSTINTVIYITTSAWAKSNANRIYGFEAHTGYAIATNGIYYYGSTEGNISIMGGTIEGLNGFGCKIQNATQTSTIDSLHVEGSGFTQGIVLIDCQNARISNCFVALIEPDGIVLEDCKAISISGVYSHSMNIDKSNIMVSVRDCKQGSGTWIIDSSAGNIENVTFTTESVDYQSAYYGGISPYGGVNLCQGDLELWSGGLPPEFTSYGNCTIAQETTIVCFGNNSAKLTRSATAGIQGMKFIYDSTMTRDLLARDALNLREGNYTWTLSTGGGTNEYYLQLSGGDPDIEKPITILENWGSMREGTAGSLAANYWDYGNVDGLGYNTIYVRLSDSSDPDGKASGYAKACYRYATVTVSAYFYSPTTNGGTPGISFYSVLYDTTTTVNKVFTIPDNTWTRCSATFKISPVTESMYFTFGTISGSTGDIVYVDGIEIMNGSQVSQHFISGARIQAKTPASAAAAGKSGEVCWDESYIYVCTATSTWKRAAIATW